MIELKSGTELYVVLRNNRPSPENKMFLYKVHTGTLNTPC